VTGPRRAERKDRSPDALAWLRAYPDEPEHLLIGVMSGTSADAADVAVVRMEGNGADVTHEILAYEETPFDVALRRDVHDAAGATVLEPERLMRLDAALGELYAAAVTRLLGTTGIDPRRVDAIGCHGQTVRHLPRRADGSGALTLQIGSAAILAERTGIPVVSNFRVRDAAAGGEGAPLVPIADWWLFRSADQSRVLLNVGGMANITYLARGGSVDDILAFDTGPGNAVMDALVRIQTNGALHHDEQGAGAARGRANEALLAELLADPFFALPPPRSTGREHFGDRYAAKLREVGLAMGLSEDDLLATALELTTASVASSIERFVLPRGRVDTVLVSGGGVRNRTLMTGLERRLAPARVVALEVLGVPSSAKEALAFAYLAHRTLSGLPGNVPSATGASRPVVLGQVTPGG
jgi:anhydro-N-acetylmuramic acid kinase